MFLPPVCFNQDMTAEARSQALLELEQGIDSGELTAVKKQVLRAVIYYAKKNLVEPELLTDLSIFTVCNAIFSQAGLPDLLFLQYVIKQMNLLQDETSPFKKAVLPMVQNYKRPLMLPLIRQMEKMSFGFSIAALYMQNLGSMLLIIARFFINELTAEAKIERFLNDRLMQLLQQKPLPQWGDGFAESMNAMIGLIDRGRVATVGFFNRRLQGEVLERAALNNASSPAKFSNESHI